MKTHRLIGWTALAGGAALGYALAEAHWRVLRLIEVPVLPPRAAPLRVLQVSDPHFTANQRRKVDWVRRLADLEPDLVVATGDNFSSSDSMETALEAFEPLLGLPGAFVLGSHDFYSAQWRSPLAYLLTGRRGRDVARQEPERTPDLPTAAFRGVLARAGWLDLDNARGALRLGSERLATDLVGLADPHVGWEEVPPPASRAAADLVLGLVHAPYVDAVQSLVDDGARLVLAGHTHGGQVALPGLGAIVSNTDLPRHQTRGLSRWPGGDPAAPSYLHVSAGLGASPFAPVRFAARPEATLLTLTAGESDR
ncbi:MAG: metallophosphoesterase [Bifidobacteriaceae bacterium]|jgi:predicted MPP superfamily phosphohydrolase|nr:metallophosphoesterase [Bifidobacteriaceae bacterium]